MNSMRAPSYKAIAICILQNDLNLYGLGFQPEVKDSYKAIKQIEKSKPTAQQALF